jgi:hypothetical protein
MLTHKSTRCFLLLMSIILIETHLLSAQQVHQDYLSYSAADKSAIFSENFDNNSNQWICDNLWISGAIFNGYYSITCKNYQNSTGLTYKAVTVEPGKNFEIEAAIKVFKGTGALVFGMTDKFDHYRLEITEKFTIDLIKDTPSKKKKIEYLFRGPLKSGLLKDSFNKITLRNIDGVYSIYINELLAGQVSNIKPEGNQVGFNVGTNSEISVDYLTVSYLKKQTAPLLADNNVPVKDVKEVSSRSATVDLNMTNGPKITWVSPSGQNTSLQTFTAQVKANIKSVSGLKSVLLYLNGVSKGEAEVKPSPDEAGSFVVEKIVNFGPGENNLYLVATNSEGATKSELRYFTNPSAVVPVITWSNPAAPNSIVGTESISIEASIQSPTDLKSAKLIVNGETQSEDNVFQASGTDNTVYKWQTSAILRKGDNSIYINVSNIAGTKMSEQRVIKFEEGLTEKRLALVFGNSQYRNNSTLKNPVNDANLMEGTLKELGFEVIKRLNAGKSEMEAAIREFTEKLPDYNVALFYYAGHGIQVDGKNYLIPTDALLEKPIDCKFEAVAVNFVVDEFERYPDNTNIVILDACRNNPYASWARGGEAGFKAMNFTSGTIIAFATSEGATAADGKGDNGLFTEELVKQMVVPQSVYSVFMKTRVQVKKLSNNQQVPTEWNKLDGDFFFRKQ